MKNKITIPENTRVIIDGGVIIFEEKAREPNKWYSENGMHQMRMLNLGQGKCVGFIEGKWIEGLRMVDELNWQPMEAEEVTRLLIGEAEKRGLVKGVRAKGFGSDDKSASRLQGDPKIFPSGNFVDSGHKILFDIKTGKWAEIIPEKKPIYVNAYGTELKEGEEFHWVDNHRNVYDGGKYDETKVLSDWCKFIGTERECHQYLADNWDELNKNK